MKRLAGVLGYLLGLGVVSLIGVIAYFGTWWQLDAAIVLYIALAVWSEAFLRRRGVSRGR